MTNCNFPTTQQIAGIKETKDGFKIYDYTYEYRREVYTTRDEAIKAALSMGYKETFDLS